MDFEGVKECTAHLLDEALIKRGARMFERPRMHADEAREALRLLAHATRDIEDPTEICPILGELSNGLASLAQSLHLIGDFLDGSLHKRARVTGDPRAGRAALYQVAWDVHRAAEMIHPVANAIDRAHEVEATIAYDVRDFPTLAPASRPIREPGWRSL